MCHILVAYIMIYNARIMNNYLAYINQKRNCIYIHANVQNITLIYMYIYIDIKVSIAFKSVDGKMQTNHHNSRCSVQKLIEINADILFTFNFARSTTYHIA